MRDKKTLGQTINYPGAKPDAKAESWGGWLSRKIQSLTAGSTPQAAPSPMGDNGPKLDMEKARKFQKSFNGEK